MQEIIERLKVSGKTDEWVAFFWDDVERMTDWHLKAAPAAIRRNEEDDVRSEGVMAVLKVAAEIRAGEEPWEDSPQAYVITKIHWAMHDYIAGAMIGSQANYDRIKKRWSKNGFVIPDFVSLDDADRLVDNEEIAFMEAEEFVLSCCTTAVEASIITACMTNTLREASAETGVHEKTIYRMRDIVFSRMLQRRMEVEVSCAS
jgi:hypothetical protein